jgi:hypothetical protein
MRGFPAYCITCTYTTLSTVNTSCSFTTWYQNSWLSFLHVATPCSIRTTADDLSGCCCSTFFLLSRSCRDRVLLAVFVVWELDLELLLPQAGQDLAVTALSAAGRACSGHHRPLPARPGAALYRLAAPGPPRCWLPPAGQLLATGELLVSLHENLALAQI